jgi:hypothetical protein
VLPIAYVQKLSTIVHLIFEIFVSVVCPGPVCGVPLFILMECFQYAMSPITYAKKLGTIAHLICVDLRVQGPTSPYTAQCALITIALWIFFWDYHLQLKSLTDKQTGGGYIINNLPVILPWKRNVLFICPNYHFLLIIFWLIFSQSFAYQLEQFASKNMKKLNFKIHEQLLPMLRAWCESRYDAVHDAIYPPRRDVSEEAPADTLLACNQRLAFAQSTQARLGREAAAGQLPWDLLDLVEHELYDEDYVYNSPSDSSSDSSDGEDDWEGSTNIEGPNTHCRFYGDWVTSVDDAGTTSYTNSDWRYARHPDRRGHSNTHDIVNGHRAVGVLPHMELV